jgi:hypothetical protein
MRRGKPDQGAKAKYLCGLTAEKLTFVRMSPGIVQMCPSVTKFLKVDFCLPFGIDKTGSKRKEICDSERNRTRGMNSSIESDLRIWSKS